MEINKLRSLVIDDILAVDSTIQKTLQSDIRFIEEVGGHLVDSGGKRMRPLLVVLVARALFYTGKQHIVVAAIVELLHTTTLLHDDVVDESTLRRGQQTANAIWGNKSSVLVGDILLSRALLMMVEANNLEIINILAHATQVLAKGEIIQLINCHNHEITEDVYYQIIRAKTGALFEASAKCACIITKSDPETKANLSAYGMHLGTAFQLIDDWMDYAVSYEKMGKHTGDDLAEGKPTLPIIHALKHCNPNQKKQLQLAIKEGQSGDISEIQAIIQDTGALDYTRIAADKQVELAKEKLSCLEDSPYREGLELFADYVTDREL